MIYMNTTIQIHYITTTNKVYQSGTFPLRGRKKEYAAYDFWKQIKKEMPYAEKIDEVIAGGEDITELVVALEKEEDLKNYRESDNLPF